MSRPVDRGKWFREWANRDRHHEEMETVEADLERTIISHTRMAEVWTKMANRCTEDPGGAAYARKKVVMYTNFSNEAQKMYSKARADADKADRQAK